MWTTTEHGLMPDEARRVEALRAAIELAGWNQEARTVDAVIEAAAAFEAYIASGADE